jgi:hypothetical protein
MGWIPKSKRTFSGFQQSFVCPPVADGLVITIFGRWWSCWNCVMDRLQHRKKNNICGCSDWILPLSWIPKRWDTLPDFHQLLIQLHPTNSLEVMKFWRSTSLLNSASRQNNSRMGLNFWVLALTKTSEVPNSKMVDNSALQWSIKWLQPVSDLRVLTIGTSTGCWIRISGQTWPSCMNQIFGKKKSWPPQKHCIWKMSLTNSAFCQLDCYEFLKSDFCNDQVLDKPVIQILGQVFGP